MFNRARYILNLDGLEEEAIVSESDGKMHGTQMCSAKHGLECSCDSLVQKYNRLDTVEEQKSCLTQGRLGLVRRSYCPVTRKSMFCFLILIAWCQTFSWSILAEAVSFTRVCPLQNEPIVILEYNATTKEYVRSNTTVEDIVSGVSDSNSDGQSTVPTLDSLAQRNLFPARECPCVSSSTSEKSPKYCTISSGDVCGVQRMEGYVGNNDGEEIVSCFLINSRTIFVRNAWPVVVLWYGALFIFSLATDNGRHARAYIAGWLPCFKDNATRIADRILENEMRIRDRMRVAALLQQRRMWLAHQQATQRFGVAFGGDSGVGGLQPNDEDPTAPLVLKTRIFHKPRKTDKEPNESSISSPSLPMKDHGIHSHCNEENDMSNGRDEKDEGVNDNQDSQHQTPTKNTSNRISSPSSPNAAVASTPSTQATCDSFEDEESGVVNSPLFERCSDESMTIDNNDNEKPAPLIYSNYSRFNHSLDEDDDDGKNFDVQSDNDTDKEAPTAATPLEEEGLSNAKLCDEDAKDGIEPDSRAGSKHNDRTSTDLPSQDIEREEDIEDQSVSSSSSSSSFSSSSYDDEERLDNNETSFDEIALSDEEQEGESRTLSVPAEHVAESEYTEAFGGLSHLQTNGDDNSAMKYDDNDKQTNQSIEELDDDDVVCTICLCEVEDGDCVGALRGCEHIFHVECLKDWLKRRNVCPLCQTPNVAARRVRRRPQQHAGQQDRVIAALDHLASVATTGDDNNNRESHIWMREVNATTGVGATIVGDEEYANFLRELEQVDDLMASMGASTNRNDNANAVATNNNVTEHTSMTSNENDPAISVTRNNGSINEDAGESSNNVTHDNRSSAGRRIRGLRNNRRSGSSISRGRSRRNGNGSLRSNARSMNTLSQSARGSSSTTRTPGARDGRSSNTSLRRLTSVTDAADAVAEGLASLRMIPTNNYYFQNNTIAARRQRGNSLILSDGDDTTTDEAWIPPQDRPMGGVWTGRGINGSFGQQQQRQLQPQLPQPSPPPSRQNSNRGRRRRGHRARVDRLGRRRSSSSINASARSDEENVMDPRVRTYRTRGPNGETRVVYRLDRIHGFTRTNDAGNRNNQGVTASGDENVSNHDGETGTTASNTSPHLQRFQSQGDGGSGNTDVLSFPWNLVPSSIQTSRFTRMLTGASRSNPNSNSTNRSSTSNVVGGDSATPAEAEVSETATRVPMEVQEENLESNNSTNETGQNDLEAPALVSDFEEDEAMGVQMNRHIHQNSTPSSNNA